MTDFTDGYTHPYCTWMRIFNDKSTGKHLGNIYVYDYVCSSTNTVLPLHACASNIFERTFNNVLSLYTGMFVCVFSSTFRFGPDWHMSTFLWHYTRCVLVCSIVSSYDNIERAPECMLVVFWELCWWKRFETIGDLLEWFHASSSTSTHFKTVLRAGDMLECLKSVVHFNGSYSGAVGDLYIYLECCSVKSANGTWCFVY